MLKYSTTKGAYGKGHFNDVGGSGVCGGHANSSANNIKVNGQSTMNDGNLAGSYSPSKLPCFSSSTSTTNGNQILHKLNSSMNQTSLGSSTSTSFQVPTNNNVLGIIKVRKNFSTLKLYVQDKQLGI